MADYKSAYSEASQYYVEHVIPSSGIDRDRYARSKERERKWNESWKKNPVNINDICDKFAPGDEGRKVGKEDGVKYVFEGDAYKVIADMASGYLRIQDKGTRAFVKLDGRPGTAEETHFKIFRREEM